MSDDRREQLSRLRREPPPLQPVEVVERAELSPRLLRLGFRGDGLRHLVVDRPASSVRLLVPTPGVDELVLPEWDGNEFLLADGRRPALRTFTPLRLDNDTGRLELEIVRHPGGAVSEWAEAVAVGAPAAISGPGAGYDLPTDAARLMVLGDETALPAVTQIVATAPATLSLDVHVEVIRPDAVIDVDVRGGDSLEWHVSATDTVPGGRLVGVVRSLTELPGGIHVWAAGEASAMQAIRSHLFSALGVERSRVTARGYWKPAR